MIKISKELCDTNVSKDYITRRRRSVIIFFITLYLIYILLLQMRYNIIDGSSNVLRAIWFSCLAFNIISMVYAEHCKRVFKGVEVPMHNEINAFKRRELICLIIPLLVPLSLQLFPTLGYLSLLGFIYNAVKGFNRGNNQWEVRR
jgi:hypothetical protein